ncbi:MAG: phosphotransferase [Bacteroidota bacterium]
MQEYIQEISKIEFSEQPVEITRKTIGKCNEVYELAFQSNNYILRLNSQKNLLYGTHKFLPLFKELQIKTPDIVAEDYSKDKVPYCYQILTKIEGEDLKIVIPNISHANLKLIATEVSHIFDKFNSLPPKKDFGGLTGMHEERCSNLWEMIENQRKGIGERNEQTDFLDKEMLDRLDELLDANKSYFLHKEPRLYYDDISGKNVMIHQEKFSGLVDLDFLRKGDYIEALGAIMACWHGEVYGKVYLDEIIRKQGLDEFQQDLVRVYAMLHLSMWIGEEGRQFNSNTTETINWDNVNRGKEKIKAISKEIKK